MTKFFFLLVVLLTHVVLATSPCLDDIRVTRAHGRYDYVRVSLIRDVNDMQQQQQVDDNNDDAKEYKQRFQHRWTHLHLSSRIAKITPGTTTMVRIANKVDVPIRIPSKGTSVRGLILGDPCYISESIPCEFGAEYDVGTRLPRFLNLVASELDFWVFLGDNLYDLHGNVTRTFFRRFSMEVKSLPFVTVVGNHDIWHLGNPKLRVKEDQLGIGFAQYYAQDVAAATRHAPYKFSSFNNNQIPHADNFFFYHALGAVGFIGFSGAHDMDPERFEEACRYFTSPNEGSDASVILLLSHWIIPLEDGARPDMDGPSLFAQMLEGRRMPRYCRPLARSGKLVYVVGHLHRNTPLQNNRGFLLGGAGMLGSGEFGFPIFEIQSGSVLQVAYFPIAIAKSDPHATKRFEALERCILKTKSLMRGCKHLANIWFNGTVVDQPLGVQLYDDNDIVGAPEW